jgi:hypothetical protein
MGDSRGTNIQGFSGEKVREGNRLEDPAVYMKIILKWVFEKWDSGEWTRSMLLRIGTVGELL